MLVYSSGSLLYSIVHVLVTVTNVSTNEFINQILAVVYCYVILSRQILVPE